MHASGRLVPLRLVPLLFLALTFGCLRPARAVDTYANVDPARVAAIEATLPANPAGFGSPITNRTYWTSATAVSLTQNTLTNANNYLANGVSATADPTALRNLVLGECIENKGRFLPLIAKELGIFLARSDWGDALNWSPDCGDIGTTLYLLGSELDAGLQAQCLVAMHAKCFDGLYAVMQTGVVTAYNDWVTADDNWPAVCWDQVICAATSVLTDRHQRAGYIACAEYYITHYRNTFTADGYCREGGGYYNYGMSRFIELREQLKYQTGGLVDLFTDPKTPFMASFPMLWQLNNFTYPPFGDSQEGVGASQSIMGYFNGVFGFGLTQYTSNVKGSGRLGCSLMTPIPLVPAAAPSTQNLGDVHTYYSVPGVLACRPSASTSHLAAAIKAGGNIASHSHNDVGSFYLEVGTGLQIGDPGGPRTYPPSGPVDNFTYDVDNSYGRSLPVIGGNLQIQATSAHPKVLATSLTAQEDDIRMDITSAYNVPALTSLVRSMRYDRQGTGALTIQDDVALSAATTFQAAITTRATVTSAGGGFLLFAQGGEQIYGAITTPNGYTLASETISELPPTLPWTRLAINLNQPVTNASVVLLFSKLPVLASNVTPTGATLTGLCNPGGAGTVASFQYGPTTAYGAVTTATSLGGGTSGVVFSANLAGLLPGTTYHFRSVAMVGSAATYGPDQVFATSVKPGLLNRTTGGTASTNLEGSATESSAMAFDGSTTTKWYDGGKGTAAWLAYQFGARVTWAVTRYDVTSANDVPGRDPKNWQFQASSDGSTWTTLDTQTNQVFAARYQTNSYPVVNTAAYPYYRLNVTANNGDASGVQLSELGLYAYDTVPPVISVPADLTVEATGSGGAVVTFATSALDNADGAIAPTNVPPSGTIFPLGVTTVTVNATDAAGNVGTGHFMVTVRDTTPPQITVPADLVANATSATGAYVTFATSAVDTVSGNVAATNTPASGAFFPLGVTTVNVTSRDAAGNAASRTFHVAVMVPAVGDVEKAAPALAVSGGQASLTIPMSVPGRTYQLQRSDTLAVGSWTNLGNAQVGNGGKMILSDSYDGSLPTRFYRILLGP